MLLPLPIFFLIAAFAVACFVGLLYTGGKNSELREWIDRIKLERDQAVEQDAEDMLLVDAVLRASDDAIIVVDETGACKMSNRQANDLFERSDDCNGQSLLTLSHSAELDALFKQAASELPKSDPLATTSGEVVLWAFHGVSVQAVISLVPLAAGLEHSGYYVVVLRDVTELRRLTTMRRDFVANVSHELRTPLSSVRLTAETLLDGALEDEQMARHFLNTIVREAERLVRLADDLLQLSRVESMPLERKPCDIAALIEDVAARFRSELAKSSVTVESNIKRPLNAECDPDEIAQVLLNLLDNAIKYTSSGGKVSIQAKPIQGWIVYEISDNGIGILQQDIPRVFERFYRTDKARDRQRGGTGLGLAIVKHIVERHNGEVWVLSEYNHGSTFGFAIPENASITERPKGGFHFDLPAEQAEPEALQEAVGS